MWCFDCGIVMNYPPQLFASPAIQHPGNPIMSQEAATAGGETNVRNTGKHAAESGP
jgi:hypothetical protein